MLVSACGVRVPRSGTSASTHSAPRVRIGRERWFNLLWLLPIVSVRPCTPAQTDGFRQAPSISVVIAALSIEAKSSGAGAAGSLRRHAPPSLDLVGRPAWSFAAIRARSTPSARRSSGVIFRARSISSSWASRAPAAHNSRERERSPFAADEAMRTGYRRARSTELVPDLDSRIRAPLREQRLAFVNFGPVGAACP